MSTPFSHRVQGSPLRAPQQALLPHRPPLDAPDMHPPTCRALGAEPTDPTLLGHTHRNAGGNKGGTHRNESVVSALGTLPVSAFELRALHTPKRTRSLGRYYAAPTATVCPYRYPCTVPMGWAAP